LANKACRLLGFMVRYWRTSRLLQAVATARADSSYATLIRKLQKTELLLLHDWGLSPPQLEEARDLLDILEDRNQTQSTLITSQMPINQWHNVLADPTLADAILRAGSTACIPKNTQRKINASVIGSTSTAVFAKASAPFGTVIPSLFNSLSVVFLSFISSLRPRLNTNLRSASSA